MGQTIRFVKQLNFWISKPSSPGVRLNVLFTEVSPFLKAVSNIRRWHFLPIGELRTHPFHIAPPSEYGILLAVTLFALLVITVKYLHGEAFSVEALVISAVALEAPPSELFNFDSAYQTIRIVEDKEHEPAERPFGEAHDSVPALVNTFQSVPRSSRARSSAMISSVSRARPATSGRISASRAGSSSFNS